MNEPLAIVVITPSTGICRMEFAQSLARLIGYFAQYKVFDNEEQYITTDSILGSMIGGAYEELVLKYLNDKNIHWTHFLCIEDDMGFAPECLHILARHDLDIVGANYSVNKGFPLYFTATNGNECVHTKEKSTGLEEVKYIAQGFTLIKRQVFEKIPTPWFLNSYNSVTKKYLAQDYYFSDRARENGFQLYIDHDVSKRICHMGSRSYTYKDVEFQNKKKEI